MGVELHLLPRTLLVVAIATLAVAWASKRRRSSRSESSSRLDRTGSRGVGIGLLWAVAGALPLAVSVSAWSAHEYLFALCGAAVLVGSWASSQTRWLGPVMVAAIGVCSRNTSGLDNVAAAPNAWSTQSHFNRAALAEEMRPVAQYSSEFKRLLPRLAPKTTLFISDVPRFWDVGGERLLRTWYRDSSLRAYDLTQFSLDRAKRGPAIFIGPDGDRLREISTDELREWSLEALRGGSVEIAYDGLTYVAEAKPSDFFARYWVAWVAWSRGDTTTAIDGLQRLGMRTKPGEPYKWDESWAQKTLAAGDTARSIELLTHVVRRQALDPAPHRRLASVARWYSASQALAEVEAYAAKTLERRPPVRAITPPPVAGTSAAKVP